MKKKKYCENENEWAKIKEMQEKMFEEARRDMNKEQENNMDNFVNIFYLFLKYNKNNNLIFFKLNKAYPLIYLF